MPEPRHLGDGVYIQNGRFGGELILTTGSHETGDADNVIYLDPRVVESLKRALENFTE